MKKTVLTTAIVILSTLLLCSFTRSKAGDEWQDEEEFFIPPDETLYIWDGIYIEGGETGRTISVCPGSGVSCSGSAATRENDPLV